MRKRITLALVLTLILTFFISSVAMAGPPEFVIDKQLQKWQERSTSVAGPPEFVIDKQSQKWQERSLNVSIKLKDVQPNNPFYKEIQRMVDLGIISGYPDGYFRPENQVQRDQFAKMLVLSFDLDTKKSYSQTFEDVTSSHTFYKYIEAAKPYLTGFERDSKLYYFPQNQAVREDVTVAVIKAQNIKLVSDSEADKILKKYVDSDTISQNLRTYVATAIDEGLVMGWKDSRGDWRFGAQQPLKRVEAALLLYRANKGFEKIIIDDEDDGEKVVVDDQGKDYSKGDLRVNYVKPADGATGVAVDLREIEVRFNRDIEAVEDYDDVLDGITVKNTTKDREIEIDRIRIVDNKLFIRLANQLDYNCRYRVEIEENIITDKYDNELGEYNWTFRTEK